MSAPLELLPKFAPIVARHFAAYLELFSDEATELGSQVARRVAAVVAALLALSFALAMACLWILNAVWDTPWRQAELLACCWYSPLRQLPRGSPQYDDPSMAGLPFIGFVPNGRWISSSLWS